ncbi:hypothetical protein K438DRAFT_643995 [Mycena galopus ATCC 62051]|nr:hypothetical protein K438DRAFT_643995 [Mycena galopus ATCC 62051]
MKGDSWMTTVFRRTPITGQILFRWPNGERLAFACDRFFVSALIPPIAYTTVVSNELATNGVRSLVREKRFPNTDFLHIPRLASQIAHQKLSPLIKMRFQSLLVVLAAVATVSAHLEGVRRTNVGAPGWKREEVREAQNVGAPGWKREEVREAQNVGAPGWKREEVREAQAPA